MLVFIANIQYVFIFLKKKKKVGGCITKIIKKSSLREWYILTKPFSKTVSTPTVASAQTTTTTTKEKKKKNVPESNEKHETKNRHPCP